MAREQVLYRMLPAEAIEKGSCALCAMSHVLGSLSRLRGALIQGYPGFDFCFGETSVKLSRRRREWQAKEKNFLLIVNILAHFL